ncbi:MAG: hypothetical protein H7X97_08805, partial [Opitutaceae bacterium]|nr:hypothetical protein [Verrucomicrobiales bacterium]
MKTKLILLLIVGCAGLIVAQAPPVIPPPATTPATNSAAQRYLDRQREMKAAAGLTNASGIGTNRTGLRLAPGQVDPRLPGAQPAFPAFPTTTLPTPPATTAATPTVPGAAGVVVPAIGAVAPPGAAADAAGGAVEKPIHEYRFNGAPLEQILTAYEELVGRTTLRSYVGAGVVPGTTVVTFKTQSPLTK